MNAEKKRSECPISCALDILGDKWSLLILRDMMFYDKSTFGDFLDSSEKIATNVLTDKLKSLTNEGLIFKHAVPGKARVGYSLTERGISLVPIMIEYLKWGDSQEQKCCLESTDLPKKSKYTDAFVKKMMLNLNQKLKEKLKEI